MRICQNRRSGISGSEVVCTPLVAEFYVGAIVPVDTLGMLRSSPQEADVESDTMPAHPQDSLGQKQKVAEAAAAHSCKAEVSCGSSADSHPLWGTGASSAADDGLEAGHPA